MRCGRAHSQRSGRPSRAAPTFILGADGGGVCDAGGGGRRGESCDGSAASTLDNARRALGGGWHVSVGSCCCRLSAGGSGGVAAFSLGGDRSSFCSRLRGGHKRRHATRTGARAGGARYQKAAKTRTCRASTSRPPYHLVSHRARPHQTDSVPCRRHGTMMRPLLHACHAANGCRSLARVSGQPSLSSALGARGPRCRCPSRRPQQQRRAAVRRRRQILRRESSLSGRTCGLWVNGCFGRRRLKAARGGVGRAGAGG